MRPPGQVDGNGFVSTYNQQGKRVYRPTGGRGPEESAEAWNPPGRRSSFTGRIAGPVGFLSAPKVTVKAVGRKEHNRLFIRGKEYKL